MLGGLKLGTCFTVARNRDGTIDVGWENRGSRVLGRREELNVDADNRARGRAIDIAGGARGGACSACDWERDFYSYCNSKHRIYQMDDGILHICMHSYMCNLRWL